MSPSIFSTTEPRGQVRTGALFRRCAMWLAAVALPLCAQDQPDSFEPGKETSFNWQPVRDQVLVYVPVNYDPERTWPVVFHYHGQNGSPTTAAWRTLMHGRDVIVVGMTYIERGARRREPRQQAAYLAAEIRQLGDMVAFLGDRLAMDRERLFLCGVSKGGWQVSAFVQLGMKNVAGALIMLAGRQPGDTNARLDGIEGKPIYLGAGEGDPNNPYARWAVELFERSDAQVTWDEYAGLDHAVNWESERLLAWINVHVRPRECGAGELAEAWLAARGDLYDDTEAEVARYRVLKATLGHPYMALCPRRTKSQIEAALEALRGDPDVRREARAERDFERLLRREMLAGTLSEYDRVISGYRRIAESVPDSPVARAAEKGAIRVEELVEPAKDEIRSRLPKRPRINR